MRDKSVEFHFLLSKDDFKRLSEIAVETNVSKSKVLRDLIRGSKLIEAPPADYPMLIRELRAVGNNLNQTLVIAKANGILNVPDLQKEILDLREVEKKISSQFDLK